MAALLEVGVMFAAIAAAALSLGVSEAVAAFFVGMAVSGTDHVRELERLLEPLRDTFAAVFLPTRSPPSPSGTSS